MIEKYFTNFWVWWYFINVRQSGKKILQIWLHFLAMMNIVPMLKNLFVPMYQDYSFVGRIIGFLIRSVWIFFGSIFQIFITIPLVILFLIILVIPLLPVAMIVMYFAQ